MDIDDENFAGDSGNSGSLSVTDANLRGDSSWSIDQDHPQLDEARARRDKLLAENAATLEQMERTRKILGYVWATILFFGFSSAAFYIGFWYAMNHGVCP